MVVNHVDNSALYLYAVDRLKNEPLMNKIFECSGLLEGLEDKEASRKLSAAISDAIELAEDYKPRGQRRSPRRHGHQHQRGHPEYP